MQSTRFVCFQTSCRLKLYNKAKEASNLKTNFIGLSDLFLLLFVIIQCFFLTLVKSWFWISNSKTTKHFMRLSGMQLTNFVSIHTDLVVEFAKFAMHII